MTEQAIMLAIPSLQLELPLEVRKKLVFDKALKKKFAKLIKDLYEQAIESYYVNTTKKCNVSNEIASKFQPSLLEHELKEASD